MGSIIYKSRDLLAHTSEIVGYKSGLALNEVQLREHSPEHHQEIFTAPPDSLLRIRAEGMEELIAAILYRLGTVPYPDIMPSHIRLYHRVKDDAELLSIYMEIMSRFPVFLRSGMDAALKDGSKKIDPRSFVEESEQKHGIVGMKMALDIMLGVNTDQLRSPWTHMRQTEWRDTTELKGLFSSESLDTMHGSFFDQRFIDYLSRNFPEIDRMNWRKFEALVCEFFEKNGWCVKIGPGRNDNGVDARVWPKAEDKALPPAIVVQCKRQKEKVSKVVVKSLYADILSEGAMSGLVVTTNALSPGAEQMRKARSYPIETVDRKTLRSWVEAMRSPQNGIFLSE